MVNVMISDRIETLLEMMPGLTLASLRFHPEFRHISIISGELHPFARYSIEDVACLAASATAKYRLSSGGALEIEHPEHLPAIRRLPDLSDLQPQSFKFEMWIGSDGKHPLFFATEPQINRQRFPDHPHLLETMRPLPMYPKANALCVYPPHYGIWDAKTDALAIPITWLALWFAKHHIWQATGTWLGEQASHFPATIWHNHKDAECFCGSTDPMHLCHPPSRMLQAIR